MREHRKTEHHRTQNPWSFLPDINLLSETGISACPAFFADMGKLLAKAGATERFCVTLLHSHFNVFGDEILVDAFNAETQTIICNVCTATEAGHDLVPKSWMFAKSGSVGGFEDLRILSWVGQDDLPQACLASTDFSLMHRCAEIYREHRVIHNFGMALIGPRAPMGMIWTEDTDFEARHLVQRPVRIGSPENDNAMITVWHFDSTGKVSIAAGCCRRTRDGSGHTGLPHPKGW
jgi:hypothetical protein